MLDIALELLQAGLSVLPADLSSKRPTLPSWKQFQQQLPSEQHVSTWFANTSVNALCLVAGAISGNVEVIDFDHEGELFERWRELVSSTAPGLVDRLTIERSQSGGKHVTYRCVEPVPRSHKLAQRAIVVDNDDSVTISGKTFKPRRVGNQYEVIYTLIETRGEGGLFLCDPTPGYQLEQGTMRTLTVVTAAERDILIEIAKSLTETLPPVVSIPECIGMVDAGRPGDDFNKRGDVRALLQKHGWTLTNAGENEHWCRPGKEQGCSATLRNKVFYVFSSNAAPFEPDQGYCPFAIYTLLEHDGDFSAAAAALRAEDYGEPANSDDVDLTMISSNLLPAPSAETSPYPDPGPLPEELLRIPGFVSEVMDYCLATAPYPNPALAFSGALALLAVLAGRKVRDQGDNRTNLYLLALAHSSSGKDCPRKLNKQILNRVGLITALGEKFASGEGIEDALFQTPAMLFQTDEIDGLLQSINKARDGRYENILNTLLTMYSSANSIYPMRRKASNESPGAINQPCLVLYGTAIPNHYYSALSERMLTNGFFARMLIIESGLRGTGQDPGIIDPPESIMNVAHWWAQFNCGTGNLANYDPQPRIVEADHDARDLLAEGRRISESEYSCAEVRGDAVGTTVWGRVPEHTRKLALLYAVSVDHLAPRINVAAVRWAIDFMMHQTRRMLFMALSHVADTPFYAECLKIKNILRKANNRQLGHSTLLKMMKMEAKEFHSVMTTLVEQGDVQVVSQGTSGRPNKSYKLQD